MVILKAIAVSIQLVESFKTILPLSCSVVSHSLTRSDEFHDFLCSATIMHTIGVEQQRNLN